MHSTVPFSPQDISGITLQEAGKAALQELSAKYPYFLPLKVIGQLLENESAALRELPYTYGVNPVVLHYLAARMKAAPQQAPVKKPVIVGCEPTQPKEETAPQKEDQVPEATAPVEEPTEVSRPEEAQPATGPENPDLPAVEAASEAIAEPIHPESVETPEAPAPEPTEMEVVEEAAGEEAEIIADDAAAPVVAPEEKSPETTGFPEINHPETPEQPLSQPASIDTAITPEPEEHVIQPLYTRDYFKHQGVSMEDAAENPFEFKKPSGNDLMVMRSFGEWLRFFHSKKVKAEEEQEDKRALKAMWQKGKLAAALEEEDEEIPEVVFEMAVKSISHEGNPATETMAKIYLGQGKWEKAIGVYEQLQLRNPQKSTYFAEKIAAIEQQHRP